MRALRFVFGLVSLCIGLMLMLMIAALASDYEPYVELARALTARDLMAIAIALALPIAFVGLSYAGSASPSRTRLASALLVASTGALFASIESFGAGFAKYASTGFVDPKKLLATFAGSPAVILALFVAWSIAWILFGLSLKPAKKAAPSAGVSRVLCALTGVAGLSLIGIPIQFALLGLSYCSLGLFMMRARPGHAPVDAAIYIDDYRPA